MMLLVCINSRTVIQRINLMGICPLWTTAFYVVESYFFYFSSICHWSVVDLDNEHFRSLWFVHWK